VDRLLRGVEGEYAFAVRLPYTSQGMSKSSVLGFLGREVLGAVPFSGSFRLAESPHGGSCCALRRECRAGRPPERATVGNGHATTIRQRHNTRLCTINPPSTQVREMGS